MGKCDSLCEVSDAAAFWRRVDLWDEFCNPNLNGLKDGISVKKTWHRE